MRNPIGTALVMGLALACAAAGAQTRTPDLRNGEDINELCAGCHGEFGEGGKQGVYPRLAGQPPAYTARQLHLFRERRRPNLAMIEYVDERQMPDEDIEDVSAYLAGIELPTRIPPVDPDAPGFDALERLNQAKRVLQIPRAEGDVAAGEALYRRECASCHGRDGYGDLKDGVPMLAGQYTDYLIKQIDKYNAGVRFHDPDDPQDRFLAEFTAEQMRDILAYVSILDD